MERERQLQTEGFLRRWNDWQTLLSLVVRIKHGLSSHHCAGLALILLANGCQLNVQFTHM